MKGRIQNAETHILALPPEITGLIFEILCGQSKSDDDGPITDPQLRRPEMIISCICQHWREVALSCSIIWSYLAIHDWSLGDEDFIAATPLLSMYLVRSRGVPLDIVVTIKQLAGHPTPDRGTVALRQFLLAILPHSARWQRLEIWLEGKWSAGPFACLEDVRVPRLELFEVGCWPNWGHRDPFRPSPDRDPKRCIALFQPSAAPNLASALLPSELLPPLACHSLSTVYLHRGEYRQPWTNLIHLLGLPNLTTLTLDGPMFFAPEEDSQWAARRVVAHKLRHFRLGCDIVFFYMWVALSMPSLVLLILFDIPSLATNDISDITHAFPGGFFPELKTLAFWQLDFRSRADFEFFCRQTPQVTELVICGCQTDGVVMPELYRHSAARSPHLWPHLLSLTYVVPEYVVIFFGDTLPETYKGARQALMQLVDWRMEIFGQECALWINLHDQDEFLYHPEELFHIPPFDDSASERFLWQKLFMPRDIQILPWPPEEETRFSYREVRFSNESVRLGAF